HDPIEGSAEALNRLAAEEKPVVFVTNSPRITPAEQARILQEHGIDASQDQVVTAGQTLIELTEGAVGKGAKIYAIGTSGFLGQLQDAGFDLMSAERWSEAAAVLVTAHPRFDYEELKAATMAVRAGAFLATIGRDPTMPMPDGLWPGTGSIVAAVETASGGSAVVAGKPEKPIFELGLKVLGLPGEARVAMVGDRLDTDVGGAQNAGIDGILVTGNDSWAPGTKVTPNHEIESLLALVK
ncbi:MAG TPA: HAD-IIA family hydrolase, partial [Solirubrobacterales bacterium]|nr:HAD-IIA family hydrolase [Solirubrobacterales bacterium]